jgi:uncharacterized DUF497 family protein
MIFEWDSGKARANKAKHGLSFEEVATVFQDSLALTFDDPDHSSAEPRELTIGHTKGHKLVFVSHCEREGRIRIISARPATNSERKQYEQGIGENIG